MKMDIRTNLCVSVDMDDYAFNDAKKDVPEQQNNNEIFVS